jgi:hypothetical protein
MGHDMVRACQALGSSVLIRLKSTRKRSRKPVRRFPPGRPPVEGPLVQGMRPDTQGDPAATWETSDRKAG